MRSSHSAPMQPILPRVAPLVAVALVAFGGIAATGCAATTHDHELASPGALRTEHHTDTGSDTGPAHEASGKVHAAERRSSSDSGRSSRSDSGGTRPTGGGGGSDRPRNPPPKR